METAVAGGTKGAIAVNEQLDKDQSQDAAAQAEATPATETSANAAEAEVKQPSTPKHPSPAALKGRTPQAKLVPVAAPIINYDEAEVEKALEFGNVKEDGTITVQDGTQVREIGQAAPEADRKEALTPFAHAYLDLCAFLDLMEKQLVNCDLPQSELNRLLELLKKNMKEPKAVGDITALRARGNELREKAKAEIAKLEEARLVAKEEATKAREAFVTEIEQLVAKDPAQIQWRKTIETVRSAVSNWQVMQKERPAIDRTIEEGLWKRLSAARTDFERKRREYFSQQEEIHARAKAIKEDLIARAEALQDSTDWGATSAQFRNLMDEWKAAPRSRRKAEDALWNRFRAAQDHFFAARKADREATDKLYEENLKVKLELLNEAEALLPVKDLEEAKTALRSVQDRWEAAGHVPRSQMHKVESRLRAVERAVKDAEQAEWRRTDPRTKARVEGVSSQLQSAIASYQEKLDAARASGDEARIKEAQDALDARMEWLKVIEKSANELN